MQALYSTWGIELEGNPTDIENLGKKLNESVRSSDDYFVSQAADMRILRTSRWDSAADFHELAKIAEGDLAILRNCLDVLDTCGAFGIGTIFKFSAPATFEMNRITTFNIRTFKPEAEYVSPTDFKSVVEAARSHPKLQIAASELNSLGGGWFSIFKALEALKRFYGEEAELFKAFATDKSRIEQMRRTANSFRHAAGGFEPIKTPMPLDDANALMRKLLAETLRAKALPVSGSNGEFGIPSLNVPDGEQIGLKPLTLDNVQPGFAMEAIPSAI